MALPIDDEEEPVFVACNSIGQYTIWSQKSGISSRGSACAAGTRKSCLKYIDRLWESVNLTNNMSS